MDNSDDNVPILQLITDPFFDSYIETLEVLANIGIEFSFKQRIPIFRVYTHLDTMPWSAEVDYARECLDTLRELMARGLEPEHRGGVYL